MATDVASLRLNVRIDEGQGPIVVLLHGINSNGDDLRPLIAHLGTGYRVIAPDLLGFGESPKPEDIDYSIDQHAQVLEATLKDLGITSRFLLFGYSLGGVIAVRYASTYPERLRRLFLLSTPFYLPPEAYSKSGFGLEYAQAMMLTWLWKVVSRQKDRNTPAYKLAAGKLRDQAQEFMRAGDISKHWDIMARTLENTISQSTFIDDLPKLTMPTVFALGVRDPIVRPDQTLALQRIKPDLEVRRIMGLTADHVLITTTPERVAAEILRDEIDTLNVGLRTGKGSPLVLLPDLQETWSSWKEAAEALGADHDVVALDLLGFGESPAPLAIRYTLDDHAAAVLSTARKEFGDQPFQIAGKGFGADVALACAATDPHAVTSVVAISPMLPDPTAVNQDPATARLMASRDTMLAGVKDERLRSVTNERVERELVPAVRSTNALIAMPARELVSELTTPVRFVLPGASTAVPGWLADRAKAEPALVKVDSTPGISNPEHSTELVTAAVRGTALPPLTKNPDSGLARSARKDPITAQLGRLNTRLLLRGGAQLLLGLPLLLWPAPLPTELVAAVLAVWIAIEATQTLVGAIGLKRRGRPWLTWAGIGVFGIVFALAILGGGYYAYRLVRWIVVIGAGLRGLAMLMVAMKASRTPGRRWVLVLDGLLSLAIALGVFFVPSLGARLLRYGIGGYLTVSGLSSIAFAVANHRAAGRRVREYLAKSL
ncbi:MAG: alpha/beta fold hydrolase [Propionicimonas sp.]